MMARTRAEKRRMLEIKNLSVSIEDNLILDNLSLSVNAGEVAAIMGPNGSGKRPSARWGRRDLKSSFSHCASVARSM